jgi:hypothetical protein
MDSARRAKSHPSCRRPFTLVLACLLCATPRLASQEGYSRFSNDAKGGLEQVPEVYVPPALPWEGPLPRVHLESVAVWSLRGEPLGSPSWADSSTLVLAAREPEAGHDQLLAYRVGNDEALWAQMAGDPVALPLIGGSGRVYVAFASGSLQAFDAADGSTVWTFAAAGHAAEALSFLEERLLVVQGSTLRVLDASDGHELFSLEAGSPPVLPPRSCAGRWFVPLSSGEVLALNPEDGSRLWSRRLEGTPTPPACHDKLLVVGTSAGTLVGLKARSGRHKWTQRLAGAVIVPPLLFEGGAYVGALDGRVYGFKSAGGHRLWAVAIGERVRRDPVLIEGLLGVAAGGETRLSFVHLPTGRVLLEAQAPGENAGWIGSPAVHGDLLALAADRRDSPDGALVVYQLATLWDDPNAENGEVRSPGALKD